MGGREGVGGSAAMLSRGCSREGGHHDNAAILHPEGARRRCSPANRKSRRPEAGPRKKEETRGDVVESGRGGMGGKK